MNKYIKSDIKDATTLMKAAIMNALNDIESGTESFIDLGSYISHRLFLECLKEAKWGVEDEFLEEEINFEISVKTPSSKIVLITFGPNYTLSTTRYLKVSISMSLSSFQEIKVPAGMYNLNEEALKDFIKEQIFLPTDALEQTGYIKDWTVDDFVVV